ncbi:MAG: hypothetical protein R3F11_17285 [Verrucomicrobiales bacterium]
MHLELVVMNVPEGEIEAERLALAMKNPILGELDRLRFDDPVDPLGDLAGGAWISMRLILVRVVLGLACFP